MPAERILLVSVLMVVGAFGLFEYELARRATTAEARTVAVNVLVMVETAYLLNCRSLTKSLLAVGLFSNPALLGGMTAMVGLQVLFTYLPFFHVVFESALIDLQAWVCVAVVRQCPQGEQAVAGRVRPVRSSRQPRSSR